jgi:hypothetical protein
VVIDCSSPHRRGYLLIALTSFALASMSSAQNTPNSSGVVEG